MSQPKPLYLFANWKMYLDHAGSLALAKALAADTANIPPGGTVVVFPSALALPGVVDILASTPIAVGAQHGHWVAEGGYTGAVSMEMFRRAGAQFVLVGHSERRHLFHETNHEVRLQVEAALGAGLTPVLCMGETKAERERGDTPEVIETQLRSALQTLAWPGGVPLIIAYEPVWAISRGRDKLGLPCSGVTAEKMHELIVRLVAGLLPGVAPLTLFGGSVRAETVREYVKQPHVDGVLVGAASTQLASWQGIITNLY